MANNFNIKLPYGYLLSNTPICLQGIGTAISPKLNVLYDYKKDNWKNYIFLQSVTKGSLSSFIKIAAAFCNEELLQTLKNYDKFNIIINIPKLREIFIESLSLFFINKIIYESESFSFLFLGKNEDTIEGCLNNETFEIYVSVISQLMHDERETNKKTVAENLSDKPPEVIHALKMYNKYANTQKSHSSKNYFLDNIISKMSAANSGYNLLNIYDLTVWQLYDQFKAYTQNRLSVLSERSFSVWGGENFDYELWLKNNN